MRKKTVLLWLRRRAKRCEWEPGPMRVLSSPSPTPELRDPAAWELRRWRCFLEMPWRA